MCVSSAPTPAIHIWISLAALVYQQLIIPGCSDQSGLFPTDLDPGHCIGPIPRFRFHLKQQGKWLLTVSVTFHGPMTWKLRNQVSAKRLLHPPPRWLPICTCKTLDLKQRGHPCKDNKNQPGSFHTSLQTCAQLGYHCTLGSGLRWHGLAAVCTL